MREARIYNLNFIILMTYINFIFNISIIVLLLYKIVPKYLENIGEIVKSISDIINNNINSLQNDIIASNNNEKINIISGGYIRETIKYITIICLISLTGVIIVKSYNLCSEFNIKTFIVDHLIPSDLLRFTKNCGFIKDEVYQEIVNSDLTISVATKNNKVTNIGIKELADDKYVDIFLYIKKLHAKLNEALAGNIEQVETGMRLVPDDIESVPSLAISSGAENVLNNFQAVDIITSAF